MSEHARGLLAAVTANTIWGLLPLYWKLFDGALATEILAHRTWWSVVFVALVLYFSSGFAKPLSALKSRRECGWMLLSAILVGSNWGAYIWAVNTDQVVGASLGYFLSPLFSVCFGLLFFAERLTRWQWVALAVAGLAVTNQIALVGAAPWLGLFLAITFAGYGVLRKKSRHDSVTGLFVETLFLAPVAIAYMLWLDFQGAAFFLRQDRALDFFFVLAGAATALPLLLFVAGSHRLKLSTIGLLFYLTPSIQFLLGIALYREPVAGGEWLTFGLIWMALIIYSVEGSRRSSQARCVRP